MANELQILVEKSGLDKTKSQYILERFNDYFQIAAEWERRAKEIFVTDEFQIVDMKIAREGRLFLKEKRNDIERARKELKEAALREGQTIDGIAKTLTGLIKPIEDHLEKQEKFTELKAAEKMRRLREERWEKEEAERREAERKQEEENERLLLENERLRKEAEERMRAENERLRKEREEQNRLMAEERRKAEEERRAIEEKARKEREKQAKILAEQKAKVDALRREQEEERRKNEELRLRVDAAEEFMSDIVGEIECPFCHSKFTPRGK